MQDENKNLKKVPDNLEGKYDIVNPELLPSISSSVISQNHNLKFFLNPSDDLPNIEIYKKDILSSQKILIVMTYNYVDSCSIGKLFNNNDNKTVKNAADHFGIEIVAVNNYNDAINEITKEEKGKCPYYACWTLNDRYQQNKCREFLELLIVFWINGGAVVLFSDNEPYVIETNLFLSMISAGFTMNGSYIGQKEIYGDETGLLNEPAKFNRKREIYKFNDIQRQTLSHNLYNIYEGVTILRLFNFSCIIIIYFHIIIFF